MNAVQSPDLRGRSVWVHVLGCRWNLCEGDFLAGDLEARGALVTRDPEGCSAAVIVSCSVTAEADRKCRQAVRRARRTVGEAGVVAVCGCWAQGAAADEARELGADILVGNRRKGELTDVLEAGPSATSAPICFETGGGRSFPLSARCSTRAPS